MVIEKILKDSSKSECVIGLADMLNLKMKSIPQIMFKKFQETILSNSVPLAPVLSRAIEKIEIWKVNW